MVFFQSFCIISRQMFFNFLTNTVFCPKIRHSPKICPMVTFETFCKIRYASYNNLYGDFRKSSYNKMKKVLYFLTKSFFFPKIRHPRKISSMVIFRNFCIIRRKIFFNFLLNTIFFKKKTSSENKLNGGFPKFV